MTIRATLRKLTQLDGLNFVLTNMLPRRTLSYVVGQISHTENSLVRNVSLWLWRCFTEIDLTDSERLDFRSMHDCFTRRLKPGARPINADPSIVTSPCDAIVGAYGTVQQGVALQVKGMDYSLADLLDDPADAASLEGAVFVTLRLTSAMYHRFHAPQNCRVTHVRYVFGDCWNVNPPTLRRVRRLFCRNERAVIHAVLPDGNHLTLVAVAAILVSGIKLSFLHLDGLGRAAIRKNYACDVTLAKGQEMGWFEHGSTIIVFGNRSLHMMKGLREGTHVRMGEALWQQAHTGGVCH
jgi:phosphatidylserine decarboxylase